MGENIHVNGWEYTEGNDKKARKWGVIKASERSEGKADKRIPAVDSTQDLIAAAPTPTSWSLPNCGQGGEDRSSPAENSNREQRDCGRCGWEQVLSMLAQAMAAGDPDLAAFMQEMQAAQAGGPAPGRKFNLPP